MTPSFRISKDYQLIKDQLSKIESLYKEEMSRRESLQLDFNKEKSLRENLETDLANLGSGSGRKERFFWQYNVQAKGPKGQKLALDTRIHDPHELNDIIDPVFSDNVQVHGIKHRSVRLSVNKTF